MATPGKLEIIIKINELPITTTNANGWKTFELDCGGRIVSVTVRPRLWSKLEESTQKYPLWVAAIAGQMGASTENGFVLSEPNIQVFERKAKPESAPEPPAG